MNLSAAIVTAACEGWNMNCGPAALCAALGMTPDQIRPFLSDFEQKGYSNPTLVKAALQQTGVRYRQVWRNDEPVEEPSKIIWPAQGLVRIQWGGRWTKPGVPMAARYRQTHWIACRSAGEVIFDINAIFLADTGGWTPFQFWSGRIVPWLVSDITGADGTWWPTHCWELPKEDAALK